MKMKEDFVNQYEAVLETALRSIKPCPELSPEAIKYIKLLSFHVSYALILEYHESLAEALKEKGIDIGDIE